MFDKILNTPVFMKFYRDYSSGKYLSLLLRRILQKEINMSLFSNDSIFTS